MPELSNIQTYQRIKASDYKPTLNRVCNVLKSIGLWNTLIEQAFDKFEWKTEDDGHIYSSLMQIESYASSLSGVKIRPLVMIYPYTLEISLEENWMSFDLLIETEELTNFENGVFYQYTYSLIRALVAEIYQEFSETGVYFTNEAQDGSDFEGILSNDLEKLWHFDYALLPLSLKNLYREKPATHQLLEHGDHLEAWHVDRWKEHLLDINAPA